jgi:hypothetical protein
MPVTLAVLLGVVSVFEPPLKQAVKLIKLKPKTKAIRPLLLEIMASFLKLLAIRDAGLT